MASNLTIGISESMEGFTFESTSAVLAADGRYQFRIVDPNGVPETDYLIDETALMHLYVVRSDLTNFHHLLPTMTTDGTWSVDIPTTEPGPYSIYVSAYVGTLQSVRHLVLRRPLTVPGAYRLAPVLPPPSQTASVDGYQVQFMRQPPAYTSAMWSARITSNGEPVDYLQPYLGVYAHLTAIKSPDGYYVPNYVLNSATKGRPAGPDIAFEVEFPGSGIYRGFLEFRAANELHVVEWTISVG
jgi:hypothetical protein